MTNKADWEAWNEERQRFRELETQGWEHDIESLTAHISKLQVVAPKDKTGWINSNALDVITSLKAQLTQAKAWAGQMP